MMYVRHVARSSQPIKFKAIYLEHVHSDIYAYSARAYKKMKMSGGGGYGRCGFSYYLVLNLVGIQ